MKYDKNMKEIDKLATKLIHEIPTKKISNECAVLCASLDAVITELSMSNYAIANELAEMNKRAKK